MTFALHGAGVSEGVAIGKVDIIERDLFNIPEYEIDEGRVATEVERLNTAIAAAQQQLRLVRERIPSGTPAEISGFIDAHLLMLDDAALQQEPERLIREYHYNAERALATQRDALVRVFDEMDDPYLRTRKDDVEHVVNRVLRFLQQHPPTSGEPDLRLAGRVVLASDLSPADTVLMQHSGITAFATEYGGPTSHTAILARSLGIPAIVGLQNARSYLQQDDLVIVDGSAGVLLVDPDESILEHYRQKQARIRRSLVELTALRDAAAVTLDGTPIALMANIELPRDFDTVIDSGAAGVGLYRTEFLYMNRSSPPSETEHYRTYREVMEKMQGRPLTIRTLDLGGDKQIDNGRHDAAVRSNPALGLRAVRLCLREPGLFRPQIRAILRASAHGPLRLMVPMLSGLQEVRQVLDMIETVKTELNEQGAEYDHSLPVGAMIEVPAAAVCADLFVRNLDFLSIGTNDLIQYTIAIDRVNEEVNYLYDPLHPAVLRLIKMTIDAGERAGVPVAMCGEMAGDKLMAPLLLGMGLREFSIHPASLLEVKQVILQSRLSELEQLAAEALAASSGAEVAGLLTRNRTASPLH